MPKQEFEDELTYQLTMVQLNTLMKSGLVMEDEWCQFKRQMLEKYKPFISQLWP